MTTPQAAASALVPATVNGSEPEVVSAPETASAARPIEVTATINIEGLPTPTPAPVQPVHYELDRNAVMLVRTTVNWAAVVITFVFTAVTAWLFLHNYVQPEVTQIVTVGQRIQATSLFTNGWVQFGLALGAAGLAACAAYVFTAQRTCQPVVCDDDTLRIVQA